MCVTIILEVHHVRSTLAARSHAISHLCPRPIPPSQIATSSLHGGRSVALFSWGFSTLTRLGWRPSLLGWSTGWSLTHRAPFGCRASKAVDAAALIGPVVARGVGEFWAAGGEPSVFHAWRPGTNSIPGTVRSSGKAVAKGAKADFLVFSRLLESPLILASSDAC